MILLVRLILLLFFCPYFLLFVTEDFITYFNPKFFYSECYLLLFSERAGAIYYQRLLAFLEKSFPDFKTQNTEKLIGGNENQSCLNTDLSFDNAEYIYDPDDSEPDSTPALPTMQTDFRVR